MIWATVSSQSWFCWLYRASPSLAAKNIINLILVLHGQFSSVKSLSHVWLFVISLIFLRSLIFPILLFSSISLHCSLRKAFLSLLAILWNSAFRWVYLSFFHLPFTSLLFSAICNTSSDYRFAFLHLFFLGMVLITASGTMSRPSVHSSSGTLSDLIPWIYLSLPLQYHKGFA